jgi:hypothetical protein
MPTKMYAMFDHFNIQTWKRFLVVMDLGRGGVCLRRDLYKDDFAELNVGRRSTAVKPVLRGYLWDKEKMAF